MNVSEKMELTIQVLVTYLFMYVTKYGKETESVISLRRTLWRLLPNPSVLVAVRNGKMAVNSVPTKSSSS